MEKLHAMEDSVLKYLTNASTAVKNLLQVKRCAQYIINIPERCADIMQTIKERPEGLLINAGMTAAENLRAKAQEEKAHSTINQAYACAAEATTTIASLLKSGTMSKDDTVKVNLLDPYERTAMLDKIETDLYWMDFKLKILEFDIRVNNLYDLWLAVDPRTFYNYFNAKSAMENTIHTFRELF